MRCWRAWISLCSCLLLAPSCGPAAALWLRVEAPLLVPAECDALEVRVVKLDEGGSAQTVSFEQRYDLRDGPEFPLTLALTAPSSFDLSTPLRLGVRALREGQLARPWASHEGEVTLEAGRTKEVVIELCDCPLGP